MYNDFETQPEKVAEIKASLFTEWPNLASTKFEITSKHTVEYNCFAYAAGESDRWWSPLPQPGYYWPPGAPRETTVDAVIAAYHVLGFEVCDNGDLENGYQKLAIYASSAGRPTHVAVQLESGLWSSKLGELEDLSHELSGLEGENYGRVTRFMKRQRHNP